MEVRRCEAFAPQFVEIPPVKEDIDGVAAQMAPLQENVFRPEFADLPGSGAHIVAGSDPSSRQSRRFPQIGGDHPGEGDEFRNQNRPRFRREQRLAARRDHHRVDDQLRDPVFPDLFSDDPHGAGTAQHPRLHGIDADIRKNGFHLLADKIRRDIQNPRDAQRVLRRHGRHGGHPEPAQESDRF